MGGITLPVIPLFLPYLKFGQIYFDTLTLCKIKMKARIASIESLQPGDGFAADEHAEASCSYLDAHQTMENAKTVAARTRVVCESKLIEIL